MKSIRFLAVALLATFALASCDKDNEGLDPNGGKTPTGNKGDIVFNIGIAPGGAATLYNAKGEAQMQTKAVTGSDFRTEFEDGDQVGVFAVRRAAGASGTTLELKAAGNYIHNVKLTYSTTDGGKWATDAGVELWHATGGDVLDFYAYYPYDAAATDPTNITFNVLADQSGVTNIDGTDKSNYGLSDLLSGSHTGVAKGTAVDLTFAHKLALVQVEVTDAKFIYPNTPLILTFRGCKAGGAFNLGTDDLTIDGGAQPQAVKMFRVEKSTDADYATKYTYRALVPAQTVAIGANLCLMAQNGQLYNTPALASALTLSAGAAKLFTTAMPITNIAVPIKAGTFMMGSPTTEPNRDGDETQHSVTLTKDFHMTKYQITNAQYAAFLNAKGIGSDGKGNVTYSKDGNAPATETQTFIYSNSWGVKHDGSKWVVQTAGYDNYPIINVTWFGAKAYADWIGGSLPTEAQWEYACRGDYSNKATETNTTPFNTGANITTDQANWDGNFPYNGAAVGVYVGKTTAVGSYTSYANNYGLYDMHGNVYEWCSDWYKNDYYTQTGADSDPSGPASGALRVLRGGGWFDYAQFCRSANRNYFSPGIVSISFGFRVVLVHNSSTGQSPIRGAYLVEDWSEGNDSGENISMN